ncbi:hypothetical protein [Variovorax ginsengisoli]|uniref:Uncharacterized protein n=1 Tax=Variovorax ginsengisoli TaxID=363844 RepID=A0ABT9S1G2_9BURK|nr:hypothetical protein [Variovorax ginsengisoli]MDP9898193.1 hypothetical protein [Variovorax ginsengisoli]
MKLIALLILPAATAAFVFPAMGQERVWRCGNEYTNNAAVAGQRKCQVMEGGNVTVIQGTRPSGARVQPAPSGDPGTGLAASRAPSGSPRVDAAEQRARDGEARSVLQAELRRAEARQAELQREYNGGEPEKQGAEARNHQKYLDRVAEMKAALARNDMDIAGIRRELGRLPPLGN